MYAVILPSLQEKSPLIWLAMSSESQHTLMFLMPRISAIRSPAIRASYSASLLVALKLSKYDCLMMVPSEVARTIPRPAPLLFDAPSM